MPKGIISVAGISFLIFVLLAVLTVLGFTTALNESLASAIHSWETPVLTSILRVVTTLGESYVYIPIALVLLAVPKLRWGVGVPAAVSLAASGGLNWVLKLCFAIPRPDTHRLIDATGFSFPSGHAMAAAAFIGIVALLFVRCSSNMLTKIAILSLAAVFVLAVGFSRVYLGVHTPMDVLAGYAMGLFLCLIIMGIGETTQRRKAERTQSP